MGRRTATKRCKSASGLVLELVTAAAAAAAEAAEASERLRAHSAAVETTSTPAETASAEAAVAEFVVLLLALPQTAGAAEAAGRT